jgi:ADP-ribose pyrophosphatase YjhB (NUDIX family)
MVAGHLEEGEKAIDAMIRETREEANIQINREDLKVAHVMFRHEDRAYADIFLTCKKYSGELRNNEPNVCDGLEFFSLEEFPENTVEYVKTAIDYIKKGVAFSDDTL